MSRTLDVYFLGAKCGLLTQEDTGEIVFAYAPEWLARGSAPGLIACAMIVT
jgi:HipA-like protein